MNYSNYKRHISNIFNEVIHYKWQNYNVADLCVALMQLMPLRKRQINGYVGKWCNEMCAYDKHPFSQTFSLNWMIAICSENHGRILKFAGNPRITMRS